MSSVSYDEIKFMGTLTASMTHEIRNVLAIIQESCGLMADLFEMMNKTKQEPKKERLAKSLSRIQAQVTRGIKLVSDLNKLAHLPDELHRKTDLEELLTLMSDLSLRLARLKEIELCLEPFPSKPIKVKTSPFYISMAFYYTLDACLNILCPGSNIILGVWHGKNSGGWEIKPHDSKQEQKNIISEIYSTPQWTIAKRAMKIAQGRARLNDLSIVFEVPFL